ncbi:MAG: hypothetical protein V1746_04795 [bacterium]
MRPFIFVLCLVGIFFLEGCATTEEKQEPDQRVSSIPWNKPQQWEGQGQLGGMGGGGGM